MIASVQVGAALFAMLAVATTSMSSCGDLLPPTSSASALSTSQIRVTWDDPNLSETSYVIERSAQPASGFTIIATLPENTTSYVDSTLPPATTRYYRIQARMEALASAYSNVASATTWPAAGATPTRTNTPLPSSTPTRTRTPTPTATPAASGGAPLWARRVGGATADSGEAIAIDPSGNVLVAGFFTGTVDFGGGALSAAGVDVFVAKYSAANAHLWSKRLGGSGDDRAYGIDTDASGNVLLTGSFQQTVNFGCGALSSALASTADIFVVKLSTAGTCQWAKSFGNGNDDVGFGVAADGANNVVVTGSFIGHQYFGGGRLWGSNNGTASSTFVAKYAPDGTHLWSRAFSQNTANNGPDTGYAVSTDGAGNVLVSGYFQGTEYFNGVSGVTSAGLSDDIYVAKLAAADGSPQWARAFGSTGSDRSYGVAVDGSGNVLITGQFAGSVDFGNGQPLVSAGALNAVVAKYTAAGAYVWAKALTGSGVNTGYSVAVDGGNNAVVTGAFQSTTNFGGVQLSSLGRLDIFVAKYTAGGAPLWAHGYGSASSDDIGASVAVDASGNAIATGYFQSTVSFAGSVLTSAGSTDVFLVASAP